MKGGKTMDKVKITIEYGDYKRAVEGDFTLLCCGNIDYPDEDCYPRVAVAGAVMGSSDLLSLHRAYVALGQILREKTINRAYGASEDKAMQIIDDIMPKIEKMEV